jgi:tRNA threonylcarbamoyladenosine biosynthesis protein TsaB
MIILALDTCCSRCSVAIFKGNNCVKFLIEETPHKQAELAIFMVEKALTESNLEYKDIDYLTCTVGPGSFTGIRIGLAAMQGINQIIKKPTLGISTLEAMSYLNNSIEVVTTLAAGKGQFYCQRFANLSPTSEIELLTEEEARIFIGSSTSIGALGSGDLPDARLLGMAALKHINNPNFSSTSLAPLYVREPDAKLPSKN